MGTNFYDASNEHIGKRSAAGMWCWDCSATLCIGGTSSVHSGHGNWLSACPKCGATKIDETLDDSAVGRELGFNEAPPASKTGVRSCSSFTWAMHPSMISGASVFVKDEYGRAYTAEEFKNVLDECPIRFFAIGQDFM
jgi:hypothetical protein